MAKAQKKTDCPVPKRRGKYRECAEVIAFHPGPPAGTALPVNVLEEDCDRLRRYEDEMLDLAIECHMHGGGRMGELARAITVLRA
ncbi:hypothetical protein U1769_24270 [Sphingomonas sp. ZT3P38]|uniref:hypothetical protein n=1 Tax=Parasphingomonas zepuensis TaxID=3096161 RepID=UPI002FC88EC3